MENLGLGLQLMVVGMVTVFCILLIVINLSKVLIMAVNKWAPEESVAQRPQPRKAPAAAADARTLSIIRAAVAQVTNGKGSVKNVTRL